jgi:hypothetical protein
MRDVRFMVVISLLVEHAFAAFVAGVRGRFVSVIRDATISGARTEGSPAPDVSNAHHVEKASLMTLRNARKTGTRGI